MWVFQTTASHIKANNYLNMGVNLRNSGYPQVVAAVWVGISCLTLSGRTGKMILSYLMRQ